MSCSISLKPTALGIIWMLALSFAGTAAAQTAATKPAGLRIVVITGEDAVNVIQQKTAVAPMVEVRDRNNQPVAGAVVRFTIEGGRATFGGARTLTITTDLAGRAAASGLTPTASGAVQISASATFQGQTAVAALAQTNVMTAAEAAAGATAGGGGGGLSFTTIALIGGAVAGGAVVATQTLGGAGVGPAIYEGDFRLDGVQSVRQVRGNGTVSLSCTATLSFTGEVRAEIDEREDGTVTGTVSANGFAAELSRTCPFSSATSEKISFGKGNVTGTAGSIQVSDQPRSADGVGFGTLSFSGVLRDGVITGTFTMSSGYKTIPDAGGAFSDAAFPATSTQVTLTK